MIEQSTRRIQDDPKDAKAYFARGYSYHALGDQARALEDLNSSIRLDPSFDARMHRSVILLWLKMPAPAIEDLNYGLKERPSDPALLNNWATAYVMLKRFPEAYEDALKALKIQQYPETYATLSEIAYNLGKYKESIDYANIAIKRDGSLSDPFYFRGSSYEKLGNTKQGQLDKATAVRMGFKVGEVSHSRDSRLTSD